MEHEIAIDKDVPRQYQEIFAKAVLMEKKITSTASVQISMPAGMVRVAVKYNKHNETIPNEKPT